MPREFTLPVGGDEPTNDKPGTIESKEDNPKPRIDEGGEPTPTPEEGDQKDTIESIEIDGKDYSLNENGDAIDSEGKVVMSKADIEQHSKSPKGEEEDASEGDPKGDEEEAEVSIADIQKVSGIELYDNEGKPVEYEMTVEGLAKREKDIKDTFLKQGQETALQEFFNSNPDLYNALLFKQKNGSLEGFVNKGRYADTEFKDKDEDFLYNTIVEAEIKRGRSPEQAKRIANYSKNDGKLKDDGKDAYDYLVDLDKKEEEQIKLKQDQEYAERLDRYKNHYGLYYDEKGKEVVVDNEGSVYNKVVTKGEIKGLTIPLEGLKVKRSDGTVKTYSRRDIFNYVAMAADPKTGMTQAQLDEANKLSNVDELLFRYLYNLTGGKMEQLVERKVLEGTAKRIKIKRKDVQTGKASDNTKKSKQVALPLE
jgi:hypothetical protein